MQDPVNELFDAACETLLAAQRLRDAAGRRGTTDAVPAVLGAVEELLEELAVCVRRLAEEDGTDDLRARLDALSARLRETEQLCGDARESAALSATARAGS